MVNQMKKIITAKSFGEEIRRRRKELGYTQAFLAEYVGVSASFLSELENGKGTIQMDKSLLVLSFLGMDCYVVARGEL